MSALFILPLRYRRYIPVLSIIEQDVSQNLSRLKQRLQAFLPMITDDATASELISFVESLYAMDQTVGDWDIDFSGWLGYDNCYEENASDQQIETDKIQEATANALWQIDALDKYDTFKHQRVAPVRGLDI